VVGVAAHAEADAFRIDARAACPGMFELFENNRAATVSHDETIAILVPRAAGFARRIVALGQRFRLTEAGERRRGARHFGAAGDNDVGVPILDAAHAETDRVGRSRAGAHHPEVRSAQAEADRQVSGDHIANGARNVERRSLLGIVRVIPGDGRILDAGEAADSRSHDRATAIAVFLGEVEARVRHRLNSRGHAVMHERIHAARFLRRNVSVHVEAFDLAGETRRKRGDIESCDRLDTAAARQNGRPGSGYVAADRRYDTEPGYDDTSLGHTILFCSEGGLTADLTPANTRARFRENGSSGFTAI
jgi:hypothetical protein